VLQGEMFQGTMIIIWLLGC